MIEYETPKTFPNSDPAAAIILDGETCRIADIRRIAFEQVPVCVPAPCWQCIAESREVVNQILALGKPVYGLNTGLGSLKRYYLNASEIETFNYDVLLAHSVPLDTPPLGVPTVRAIMASRINGLVRGGTGVRPVLIELLVEMLNRGVHPIVHGRGVSVGESDLSPLAEIGLVMVGEGQAYYQGAQLTGGAALQRAGLEPITLQAREGLGLVSANALSVGGGALALSEALQLLLGFEYAAALSMEAFRANLGVLHPQSIRARKFAGQQRSAARLRALLAGSDLFKPEMARNLQDPLSFRCVAQVHGTVRDTFMTIAQTIEDMLNSSVDSPLTLHDERLLLSTGNFESTCLSLGFDQLRLALHRLILMSSQRLNKLLWREFSGLPTLLYDTTEGSHRLGMLYNNLSRSAAVLTAHSQTTALPASLSYTPQITEGMDDYASMAPVALDRTWDMLWIARRVIVLEVLVASRVLHVLEHNNGLHQPGAGTERLYRWLQRLKAYYGLEDGAGSLEHLIQDFDLEVMMAQSGLDMTCE